MISCTLKLKLRPAQERQLDRWLWHLTGVYNWAIRKIELDAERGIYHSRREMQALVNAHGGKIGVSQYAVSGTVVTAYLAWRRAFLKIAAKPKLKSARNRLNSIAYSHGPDAPLRAKAIHLPRVGWCRFHGQSIPTGHIGQMRVIKRASGWYVCLFLQADRTAIETQAEAPTVGIDPGFLHVLTLSTGEKVEHPHELRAGADRLAQAQRGHRKRLTARLLERQANRRRDRNHKLSLRLVREHSLIAWSDDASASIARSFGKSVASAGHYQLRQMLEYKSRSGGIRFVAVESRRSTRTCSACRSLSGPTGWAGLKVRSWVCTHCGCEHDRDVNAAINTLLAARGMRVGSGREAVSGIVT